MARRRAQTHCTERMESCRVIDSFSGKYRFLSNFFVEPDGTCVEVEYQKLKCALAADKLRFDGLTPGQAKRLGRRVLLRHDWEEVKVQEMLNLVYQKFLDHAYLLALLLETGEQTLVEGNTWGDKFWGQVRGQGENELGKILMFVRERLR